MSDIDDLRAAMRAAVPSGRSAYVEDGKHVLEATLVKCNHSLVEGKQKQSWVAEFKVLESTNPTHAVGSTRAYVESVDNSGWLGRFKACLIALIGLDPALPLPAGAEDQIGDIIAALRFDEERKRLNLPENFLAGRRVICEGSPGKSRAGGSVTNKKWSPAPATS